MGSIRLETKSKVEYISLTKTFEELCPIYMSYGMTYEEYWHGDLYITKFYRESHKLKCKQKDEELWIQGMYIYEALIDVSPIIHAFSKKGTKPLPYRKKPLMNEVEIKQETEEEKQRKIENERLIAKIHFNNIFRQMEERFKDGGG